jgi:hypothetical protein
MATNKNLVIEQGTTFSANIQFLDTNKNPISLAGYSVRSKMRTSYDAANAAVLIASVSDAANGNVNLFLQSANTSLLPQGRYVYDVEAYTGNTVIRIVEGSITVSPGVSGNHLGSILKQTINSLVNGSKTVSLDIIGNVTFPTGSLIRDGYPGPYGGSGDGSSWFVTPTGGGGIASPDGKQYIQVDNVGLFIGTIDYTNNLSNQWTFSNNGSIIFPDNTSQSTAFISNNYISKATLKAIVANSATYTAFQANIAAL